MYYILVEWFVLHTVIVNTSTAKVATTLLFTVHIMIIYMVD